MFLKSFYISFFLLLNSLPAFSLKNGNSVVLEECKRSFHSVLGSNGEAKKQMNEKSLPDLLFFPIEHLNFLFYDFKQYIALRDEGIRFIWELVEKTEFELLRLRGFEMSTIDEVKNRLLEVGLKLGMDFNGSSAPQKRGELVKQRSFKQQPLPVLTSKEEQILNKVLSSNGKFRVNKKFRVFEEIAQDLNLTVSNIWEIHRRALSKLSRLASQLGYSHPRDLTLQQQKQLIKQQKNLVNLAPVFSFSIEKLGFSVLVENVLKQNGIYHVGDLADKTDEELFGLPYVRKDDVMKIKKMLSKVDVKLGVRKNWSSKGEEVQKLLEKLQSYKPLIESVQSLDTKIQKALALSIEKLELPVIFYEALKNQGINHVGGLVAKPELTLLEMSELTREDLNVIRNHLVEMGLFLGMRIQWPSDPKEEQKLVKELQSKELANSEESSQTEPVKFLDIKTQKKLSLHIKSLNLPTLVHKFLIKKGKRYIGALVTMKEQKVLKMRNFGQSSFFAVKANLLQRGLSFGMDILWPSDRKQEEKLVNSLQSIESSIISVESLDVETQEKLALSIESLSLFALSEKNLKKVGIEYIGDLVKRTELDLFRLNLSERGLAQIRNRLSEMGFQLGMNLIYPFKNRKKVKEGVNKINSKRKPALSATG